MTKITLTSFRLGVKVMHRSRVCYLTTLEVKLPGVEIPPEWDLSQTCASRQLLDNGRECCDLGFCYGTITCEFQEILLNLQY